MWYLSLLVVFKQNVKVSIICMQMMNLKTKNADCSCIIARISKNEAIKLLQDIDFIEKSGTL